MTRAPALCDRCGTFFPSLIELGTSAKVSFQNVSSGPCPRCGGQGHIPDGTYLFVGKSIELLSGPKQSRSDLQRLAAILNAATSRGDSFEQISQQVHRELPELSSLSDILPKTRGELYAFIGILVTIITLLLSETRRHTDPNIEINQVITQITQVVTAPPNSTTSAGGASRASAKVGRNDPCTCGSGKKYKNCCLPRP